MWWLCCCGRRSFGRAGFYREELDGGDWASWADHPARGRYQVSKQLGEVHWATVDGGNSLIQVLAARHIETGAEVALKIIFRNRPGLRSAHWEVLRNEVRALEDCAHPNIVALLDHYENSEQMVMVLELLKGGELLQHIQEIRQYTERKAAQLFIQILSAVAHMHSKGYIHRDVKPENVIFVNSPSADESHPCVVKLIDLGMATIYDPQRPIRQAMGTAGFLSPECCHKVPHTMAMDMWSLGVMLFVMLCGRMPYSHNQIEDLQYPEIDIRRSPGARSPQFKALSAPAKNLLLLLLERNPRDRATAPQVLRHPWITHFCGQQEGAAPEARAPESAPSVSEAMSFVSAQSSDAESVDRPSMDAAASLDLSVQAGGSEGSDESYHRGAEQAGPRAVEPRRTFLSPRSAAAALAEGQPGVTGVLKVAKQEVVGSLQEMVAATASRLSGPGPRPAGPGVR
eukprot:jgi/Tetstr1/462518/TSEL_007507.t1